MKDEITAMAHVDVQIKIKVPSTWNYETTMGQIDKQAKAYANNILHQRFVQFNDMTLVGDAKVTTVIAKRGTE